MKTNRVSICCAGGLQPSAKWLTGPIPQSPTRATELSQSFRQVATQIEPVFRFYWSSVFYCGACIDNRDASKAQYRTSRDGEPPQQSTLPGRDYGSARLLPLGEIRESTQASRPGGDTTDEDRAAAANLPHRKRGKAGLS